MTAQDADVGVKILESGVWELANPLERPPVTGRVLPVGERSRPLWESGHRAGRLAARHSEGGADRGVVVVEEPAEGTVRFDSGV